jgi:hypothetical protein
MLASWRDGEALLSSFTAEFAMVSHGEKEDQGYELTNNNS